jgi:hypothetical protein
VVGFTAGSRGEVPGERKHVIKRQQKIIIIMVVVVMMMI